MASSFARQLQAIALNSTHELDLRARRSAHAESLIFPKDVAVKQDWDTLYQLCVEGYIELCQLDSRLTEFERNLFSEQSKDQDRDQLNKSHIQALDIVIESCLNLLGPRLVLRPGVRCLEWLIRRFRVHVHNVGALLCTVLPYHEEQLFINVLSIVPKDKLVDSWKWLRPYRDVSSQVPRHAVVYAMTNNDGFFDTMNAYAVKAAQSGAADKSLLRVWGSVIVETVSGRLMKAKSGRTEVQRQKTEDVLLKVLPLINDGMLLDECPEMILVCFTLSLVMSGTGLLEDMVLDRLMEATSNTLNYSTMNKKQVLVTISILAAQKEEDIVSPRVIKDLMKVKGSLIQLQGLRPQYPVQKLLHGIIRGILDYPKKKHFEEKLEFLDGMLRTAPSLVEQADLLRWLITITSHIQRLDSNDAFQEEMRERLINMLQRCHESDDFSQAFAEASTLGKEQGIDLEAILQISIHNTQINGEKPVDAMDIDEPQHEVDRKCIEGKRKIAQETSSVESFFTKELPQVFSPLVEILQSCINAGKVADFEDSENSLFGRNETCYVSFLVRVACGDQSVKRKTAAAQLLTLHLKEKKHNCQVLLPYATVLLADPAAEVREAAADLVKSIAIAAEETEDENNLQVFGKRQVAGISTLSPKDLLRIIKDMYLPVLAECTLDENQIGHILRHVLNGSPAQSPSSPQHVDVELKKHQRTALSQSLIDHAIANPVLRFTVALLNLLDGVHKVGSSTKVEAFSRVLKNWLRKSQQQARLLATSEGLELRAVDRAWATLISASDRQSIDTILQSAKELDYDVRSDLVSALFERIARVWSAMNEEAQAAVSRSLIEMSFSGKSAFARGARSTLQQVPLSTPVLKAFIEECVAKTPNESDAPAPKRRRTSHGRAPPSQLAEALNSVIPRLSLTLELAEGSKPEARPELLPNLFDVMLVFRRLKGQSQPVSPYLLNLCLGSINAIIEKQRHMRRPNIDMSVIRADVITDFVRTTESPQVQATALQLLASLAALAPERIIHNIMPVFTFMGSDVLSKDDDHSVTVVNQAIDWIIPPLVATLKKQDEGSLIRSTVGLLSSFVAAFDHIPRHRKVRLYQRLLTRLGIEDFGFALIAMLVSQKEGDKTLPAFFGSVVGDFSPVQRLVTYRSIVGLVQDIFSSKPQHAEQLVHVSSTSSQDEKQAATLLLLETAADMLDSKHLKTQIKKIEKSGPGGIDTLQEEYRVCLHQILETLRDNKQRGEEIVAATRLCLSSLLQLFTAAQLTKALPDLMHELSGEDDDLKPMALRVLAGQLPVKAPKDGSTADTAISYLAQLKAIVEDSEDAELTYAAINCIKRISEAYGRKDIDAIIDVASFLANEDNKTQKTSGLKISALLCLASIMDVVKEAAVPIVPMLLHRALTDVKALPSDKRASDVHDAACAVMSAIFTHVPYMVDESSVERIVFSLLDTDVLIKRDGSREIRRETFDLLASKIDIATIMPHLGSIWRRGLPRESEFKAFALLDVAAGAVQHHSKSQVIKSAELVSDFILVVFDTLIRPVNTHDDYTSDEADDKDIQDGQPRSIQQMINEIAIKFIYKLNDRTFRSIFESWVEWSTTKHRQIAVFRFLRRFFSTLKSIVTSYAAYLIEPANSLLADFITKKPAELDSGDRILYRTLLAVLEAAFTHDADTFFANPSHFSPLSINILSQLNLASSKALRPLVTSHVIPAIVALATAVQDTSSHHMAINHALCQLRHSDSSPVRLASIETQIALTEAAEVGDEWINNVVSGTTNVDAGRNGGGSGETMIYVNEMLEDDDEEVEGKVRKWARMVRERVGEDVFTF